MPDPTDGFEQMSPEEMSSRVKQRILFCRIVDFTMHPGGIVSIFFDSGEALVIGGASEMAFMAGAEVPNESPVVN